MDITWTAETTNYLVGTTNGWNNSGLIAGFDMDDTLIRTKSGKSFFVDENDYILYDDTVINKLKKYSEEYSLIIVTNQLGVSKGKITLEVLKKKLVNTVKTIGLEVMVLCSFKDDNFRKPRTGLLSFVGGFDKTRSFFCGDAGGLGKRTINSLAIPKDFSDSDKKFAHNAGIRFIHRDEFIYDVTVIDESIQYPIVFNKLNETLQYVFIPQQQEVIICVGYPGSGKSHFVKNSIVTAGYSYINQDTGGTLKKCLTQMESELKKKKSVVVDNTNTNIKQRKVFTDLAKKYGVKYRCLLFNTPIGLCMHNAYFRSCIDGEKMIPKIVYNVMQKNYVEPSIDEGFFAIDKVEFHLNMSEDRERLYKLFYF